MQSDRATRDNQRGAFWMMLAMFGFALEDAFFKTATGSGGITAGMATLLFGLGAMMICIALALWRRVPVISPVYLGRGLVVRSIFEVSGRLFFALALAYTPLSTTSAILQAAPLAVMLGAAIFLKERIGVFRWMAMAVGLVGVMLILRPTAAGLGGDAAFALLGMLGFAGRDLATRAAPPSVHEMQLNILGFAMVAVAGAVILSFEPGGLHVPTQPALGLVGCTAVVGVIGYGAMTRAMRTGDIGVVAPFRYFRLLAALILAYTLFGERPDAATLTGSALVVGAGIFSLWRERRVARG